MYTPGVPGYDKSLPLFMQHGRERAHMDVGPYRNEVRRAVTTYRDVQLSAYLIDSENPSDVVPVDIDDPETCEFGFCDDAGRGVWHKEIAFIVTSGREESKYIPAQDYDLRADIATYLSARICLRARISFEAQMVTPAVPVGYPEWQRSSLKLGYGGYVSDFTDGIVNYTNRPGVSDYVHPNGMQIDLPSTTELLTYGIDQANAWNETIPGISVTDNVAVWNMSLANFITPILSFPETNIYYERTRYVRTYGYRLFAYSPAVSYPYEQNTVEITGQLHDWSFLCD
jgi:hypothetical protein